jgi:hypothetical protein
VAQNKAQWRTFVSTSMNLPGLVGGIYLDYFSGRLLESSGSHGHEYENGRLLGRCTMQSYRNKPLFQRFLLPP